MPGSKQQTRTLTNKMVQLWLQDGVRLPSGSITACDTTISLLWRITGQAVTICDTFSEKSRSPYSAQITYTAVNRLYISTGAQGGKPACSVKSNTGWHPCTSMSYSHSADFNTSMQIRKTKPGHPGKAHMNLHILMTFLTNRWDTNRVFTIPPF